MTDRPASAERTEAIQELARGAYRLSAADSRLRGRATRSRDALSLAHARALKSLAEAGPMTVGQLATRVETTGAAVTQLVNGLEAAGFVTRDRASTGDRRTSTVALTESGRLRHTEREDHLSLLLKESLADLDDASLSVATEVLNRLAAMYDSL